MDPKPPSQQAQRPHARPDPSRLSGAAARHSGAGSSGHGAADDDDDDEVQIVNTPNAPSEPQRGPIFELFWQGRLIPGAHLDSLPFIDETRMGRSATDRGEGMGDSEGVRSVREGVGVGEDVRGVGEGVWGSKARRVARWFAR